MRSGDKKKKKPDTLNKILIDTRLLSFVVRRFGESNVNLDEAETLLRSQLKVDKPSYDSRPVYQAWSEGRREESIQQMGKIFKDLATKVHPEAGFSF